MKIQPITTKINTNNYSQKSTAKSYLQNENLSFKASLNVDSKVYSVCKGSIGRAPVLKEAIQKFKNMLSAETTFASDKVNLFECPFDLAQRTGNIKIAPKKSIGIHRRSDESYSTIRPYNIEPIEYTTYTTEERANLGMSLNDKAEIGFYYDDRRSVDELANDLFNTYKHLRYQSHYTGRNEMIYEKRKSAQQGYKVTWYNRFDQPVKETYSFSVDSLIKHRTTMYKYADDGSIVDIQYSSEYQNGV